MSCEGIHVSWLPPESQVSGGLPIISYRMCRNINGTELCNFFRIGDEKAEVHGLQPNTSYAITVSANNTLGWGGEVMISNTTMARMKEQLFSVSKVTSKSLTVTAVMMAAYTDLQCDMSPNADGVGKFKVSLMTPEEKQSLNFNTNYTIYCMALGMNGSDACAEQTMHVTTRKNRELLN